MLDFPRRADHGSLAVGFDLVGRPGLPQYLGHQQFAQRRRVFQDLRTQVFLERQARPRITDHGGCHDHDQRPLCRLAAFDAGLFNVTDDLAHLQGHLIAPRHKG
ncbi:hypothetical protein D3C77_680750 [compost metagenome]